MNKGLWFLCGAVIGASVTYLYLNKKHNQHEKKDSDKAPEEKEDSESFEEASFTDVKDTVEKPKDDFDKTINRILEQEPDPEERKKVSDYVELVKKYNKEAAQEFSARTGMGPYVIDPTEYGDFEDYTTICLTHFADGVLVDDAGDIMTKEEIDESVGQDYADYFGTYSDDLVVIRNDDRCADYHIERDLRNSFEVDEVNNDPPHIDWGEDD